MATKPLVLYLPSFHSKETKIDGIIVLMHNKKIWRPSTTIANKIMWGKK